MKYTFTIETGQHKKRIDALAAQLYPQHTRSQWQKNGVFTQGKETKKANTKTQIGQTWTAECVTPTNDLTHITPWDTPITVLAEGDTWAVVAKPEGISVHPSQTEPSEMTLLNAVLHHFGEENLAHNVDVIDGKPVQRLGLVHRLDKCTSGCLIIAKTTETLAFFQKNWKDVDKEYLAVVSGVPPLKAEINGEIGRHPTHRTRMAVVAEGRGKTAKTTFDRIWSNKNQSTINVQLHTGRTHQIRVHLSSIGFPLLGDKSYGGKPYDRVLLHAHRLTFPTPEGETHTVVCPPPFAFAKYMEGKSIDEDATEKEQKV